MPFQASGLSAAHSIDSCSEAILICQCRGSLRLATSLGGPGVISMSAGASCRDLPSGTHVFRYHAGGRAAQAVLLAVRIVVAAALCGLLLWGVYSLLFGSTVIRAQFG